MKKILLIQDNTAESEELIDFAVNSVKNDGDLIVTFFHQAFIQADLKKLFNGKPNTVAHSYYSIIEKIYNSNKNISKLDTERILKKCIENKIQSKVCVESEIDNNLIHETLFADIVLVSQSFLNNLKDDAKSQLFSIINRSHCPVLVVPNSNLIKNLVLVYDGSEASVNAIKYFNYVLPEFLQQKRVYVISTAVNNSWQDLDNLLMQYTKLHIPSVGYMRLDMSNIEEIKRFIQGLPQTLFVVGALNDQKLNDVTNNSRLINNESHLFIAS